MDLGVTDGIVSHGPERNPALAALGSRGSDITVNLSGNLTMYSSAIASLAGGALTVNAGGAINLGAPDISFDNGLPRGIYTAAKADVSVIAGGNIDLEGSRIASYDGGNILVRSLSGGINAGSGGLGAQTVQRVTVDPVTGQVVTFQDTIPGSGILATSFPEGSANPVGNITVETPRGTINGGAGGIVQLTLNGVKSLSSVVSLNAGSVDANGVVTPGDINLSGSAVIGINIRLNATGNITGNAVASHDINIASRENVSVSAVGGGNVSVSASGAVSGTIVGVGSVSASGANVEANLLSQNVQAGSSTTGQSGFTATAAAGATSQSSTAQAEPTKLLAKVQPADSNSDDSGQLKKKPAPVLVRRVSRVTVILPGK
jgi:hypothetical protein